MSADYKWVQTTRAVYSAIFSEHNQQLAVFGTITNLVEPGEDRYGHRLMTEWGFRDAEIPLLKIDERGGEPPTYWLAFLYDCDCV